jgi:hypothetical protein
VSVRGGGPTLDEPMRCDYPVSSLFYSKSHRATIRAGASATASPPPSATSTSTSRAPPQPRRRKGSLPSAASPPPSPPPPHAARPLPQPRPPPHPPPPPPTYPRSRRGPTQSWTLRLPPRHQCRFGSCGRRPRHLLPLIRRRQARLSWTTAKPTTAPPRWGCSLQAESS